MTDSTLHYGNTAPPASASIRLSAAALIVLMLCWVGIGLATVYRGDNPGMSPVARRSALAVDVALIFAFSGVAFGVALYALIRCIRRRHGVGFGLSLGIAILAVLIAAPLLLAATYAGYLFLTA